MVVATRRPIIYGQKDLSILYDEEYNGGNLDTTKLTVTDTGGKVSLSNGKLQFAVGTGAWGDPRVVYTTPFTRVDGLTLEYEFQLVASVQAGIMSGFFDIINPAGSRGCPAMYNTGLTLATIIYDGNAIGAVPPIVAGLWYKARIILKATGYCTYYSFDGGVTWVMLWEDSAENHTPVYVSTARWYDISMVERTMVRLGAKPSPLYSAAVGVITPTLGAELLTNGNMETGDPPTGWTAQSGATLSAVADDQSDGAQSLKTLRGTTNDSARQNVTAVVGAWYRGYGYVKATGGTSSGALLLYSVSGLSALSVYSTAQAWIAVECVALAPATTLSAYTKTGAVANDEVRFDNLSVKPLTLASCFAGAVDLHRKDALVDTTPTVVAGTQSGHAIWMDDASNPANFLLAYHDGTNVRLEKCIAGVYTSLISAAAAYSAAATLRIVAVPIAGGTNYSVALYYNNVQIGTTQTVDNAAAAYGTNAAGFSTSGSNNPGTLTAWGG